MRISDWSSDVCSSDLGRRQNSIDPPDEPAGRLHEPRLPGVGPVLLAQVLEDLHLLMSDLAALDPQTPGDVLQAGEALPVPRALGLQPAFPCALQAMPFGEPGRPADGGEGRDKTGRAARRVRVGQYV